MELSLFGISIYNFIKKTKKDKKGQIRIKKIFNSRLIYQYKKKCRIKFIHLKTRSKNFEIFFLLQTLESIHYLSIHNDWFFQNKLFQDFRTNANRNTSRLKSNLTMNFQKTCKNIYQKYYSRYVIIQHELPFLRVLRRTPYIFFF